MQHTVDGNERYIRAPGTSSGHEDAGPEVSSSKLGDNSDINNLVKSDLLGIFEAGKCSHPRCMCVHDAHSMRMLLVDLPMYVERCALWLSLTLQDFLRAIWELQHPTPVTNSTSGNYAACSATNNASMRHPQLLKH